ncbi:hypothetical protein GJ744_001796 [Endocarpon pusillum]|uniref:Uncharacterized protein n=1 Tax=Endocarpon pusillum TaxID=364733 RepID=A0A8H7ACQ5_9EURO|nr:hypothetical protein GJ744_001796 [Endocarpon pusillum]
MVEQKVNEEWVVYRLKKKRRGGLWGKWKTGNGFVIQLNGTFILDLLDLPDLNHIGLRL